MKKLLSSILVIGAILFLGMSSAQASKINFVDDSYYWGHQETWNTSEKWLSSDASDNLSDVIGTPDFTNVNAGYIEILNNQITEVGFHYTGYNNSNKAGDLFIDLDADYNWDYIFDTSADTLYNTQPLSAKKGDNDTSYDLSNDFAGTDFGAGASYREDHPVAANFNAINETLYDATVSHTNFNSALDDIVFSDFIIDLGTSTEFIIGFAPTCANDVVYEKISTVVEPATMLLFGTGLLGLAVIGRKKFFK